MVNRIHIVGISPRTGTTLIAECMKEGFEISDFENHETPLTKLKYVKNIYLTKNPQDLINCKIRLLLDNRFYVICMMRDPRDVIVSKHQLNENQYWTDLGRWKKRYNTFKTIHSHARFISIKYEDLVDNPNFVQDYINSKLPFLRKKGNFSEFHHSKKIHTDSFRALGGARPINKSSIGNWKNHTQRVYEQIRLYGGISQELIELDYEEDSKWISSDFSIKEIKYYYYKDPAFNWVNRFVRYPKSAIVSYFDCIFGNNRC